MNNCKAWDEFALEANNLLVSMTDVGEISASTMEIYPRDLLAVSWADAELKRLALAERVVERARRMKGQKSISLTMALRAYDAARLRRCGT